MTDSTTQLSGAPKKYGSGKLLASIVSAGVAVHVASYVKAHYDMSLTEEDFNVLEMTLIGFFVWLTPQNVVAVIKNLILDWKDIVKTWKSPPA